MEILQKQTFFQVRELIIQYLEDKKERKPLKLQPWQIWFFDFAIKYKIEDKKNLVSLMSLVSRYRNAMRWWEWLDGYLSDYPNRRDDPTALIFYLFKKEKDRGAFSSIQIWAGNTELKTYEKVRRDMKKFKVKYCPPNESNSELIKKYTSYHLKLIERYTKSHRESAQTLRKKHTNVVNLVMKYREKLMKGSYKTG